MTSRCSAITAFVEIGTYFCIGNWNVVLLQLSIVNVVRRKAFVLKLGVSHPGFNVYMYFVPVPIFLVQIDKTLCILTRFYLVLYVDCACTLGALLVLACSFLFVHNSFVYCSSRNVKMFLNANSKCSREMQRMQQMCMLFILVSHVFEGEARRSSGLGVDLRPPVRRVWFLSLGNKKCSISYTLDAVIKSS